MTKSFSLRDRFLEREEPILLTGVQALVRLMLLQAESDAAAGLNTGGFVSGYRGSPLGTLDSAFASVRDLTDERGIVVRPAVNEEMAATAVAGSQQIERTPDPKVQGVFSMWYGKGPGLDRASDAVRHGNTQGTSPHGGVLVAIGDDHSAKSSSLTCYSDTVAAALHLPLLYPADAEDILLFGLHGFAMSRLTGSWVGMKIVPDIADATFSAQPLSLPLPITEPDIVVPPSIGLHYRWPELPVQQELRQVDYRMPAVAAYYAANPLDRVYHRGPSSRIGLMAAGKAWNDLREALRLLGLGAAELERMGIALFKPAMIWPVQQSALDFALGLDELIVVEDKEPLFEDQLRSALYKRDNAPAIYGKAGRDGEMLFKATGELSAELVARQLGRMLAPLFPDAGLKAAMDSLSPTGLELSNEDPLSVIRKPFFCSGCPHNRSTVVPEGSRAMAGIGCHGLAAYNRPRTETFAQMGGEGIHWVGLSPFTNERHVFANMGDGTYFHSGIMAIRQAVSAGVNMTYKLLYNSAVAMTGGQSVDGELSVGDLAAQLRAEGVGTIVVVSDDPDARKEDGTISSLVDRIEHRTELDAVQLDLREREGVSVIIYEQMCATERRRKRKRGKMPDPTTRVFINELVCEGCGDCSVKSNCLSVEPVRTEFGTKRRINQSTCNKDYSCLEGFCPSFVQVEGVEPHKAKVAEKEDMALPSPVVTAGQHERLVVAGVGGTGVVTIGALLSTAAHIGGSRAGVLDQVGMAQKGGAVASHIHIVHDKSEESVGSLRVPPGQADVLIACDEIVGNSVDIFATIDKDRTWVIANGNVSITGDFTQDREAIPDSSFLTERLRRRVNPERFACYPFTRLAERLVGDAIGSNLMMVGFAFQKGLIGIDEAELMSAIEVNGQAVGMNKAAFEFGRQLAVDPEALYRVAGLAKPHEESLDELIDRRAKFLADYQDEAYAQRFRDRIESVARAERRVSDGTELTGAATRSLFKLMSYKDEYEVARLYTDGTFAKALADQFDGDMKLSIYLAPPLLAKRDKVTGHLEKRKFGSWMMPMFRLLKRFKGLRGTAFDPFGHTAERKMERRLLAEFDAELASLAEGLAAENLERAIALAKLPQDIRGFGHIKDAAVERYYEELQALKATTAAVTQEQVSSDEPRRAEAV